MAKTVISAGFLIQSDLGKYLIVRPSGKTGTTGGWGIPKGKRDPGEDIFDAAIREVVEETDLDLNSRSDFILEREPFYHYEVETNEYKKQAKFKKQVYVFRAYVPVEIEKYPFKCTTMLESGSPEVDQFEWVTLSEGFDKVVKSQKGIFDFLLKYYQYNHE